MWYMDNLATIIHGYQSLLKEGEVDSIYPQIYRDK